MLKSSVLSALMTAVLYLAPPAIGQDAAAILKKVSEAYRSMPSYHFEGSTVAETKLGSTGTRTETEFTIAWATPNKVRVEYRYPSAGTWLRVSDGKTMTRIRSITKEFKQEPASPDDLSILESTPMAFYENLDTRLHDPKLLRTESLPVGAKSVECYVIEALGQPATLPPGMEQLPVTLWIAKDTDVVLKEVTGTRSKSSGSNATANTRTTVFTVAEVNTTIPDTLFTAEHK